MSLPRDYEGLLRVHRDLARLAVATLDAQRKFFRSKQHDDRMAALNEAKERERELRVLAEESLETQGRLFS